MRERGGGAAHAPEAGVQVLKSIEQETQRRDINAQIVTKKTEGEGRDAQNEAPEWNNSARGENAADLLSSLSREQELLLRRRCGA